MTFDPAPARATAAETVMPDRCRITRGNGRWDDTFDESTLQHTARASASRVYEGACGVGAPGGVASENDRIEAGARLEVDDYRLRLPASAGPPRKGDTVTILRSVRDATLVDRTFTITSVPSGSMLITRIVRMRAYTRGPAS